MVINDRGQIGFYAELTETAGFFDESAVIRVNRDGSLVQIARDDRGAPGGAGRYLSLGDVAINDAGQVAFEGFVTGGRPVGGAFGLFRGDEAGVSTIARSEQPAPPGTDTEYQFITGLDPVAMDPAGRVVYQAQVARRLPDGSTEPIANDDFIFVGSGSADPSRGGAPTVIAREGQAPPEGGGAFGSTLFSAVQINDAGQTLFHGQVVRQTGNPDFPQDFSDGIYRADAAGNLTTIARSGELDGVEMGTPVPGSAEPFSFFRAPAFNDRGEAAFQAAVRFEGTGIFRGDGTVGADGRPELTAIAVADQAVGGGTIFSVSQGVALNNAGEATFAASLFGTPNFPNDATAILRGDGTALDIVARSGWAAPTTAGGGVLAAAAAGSAGSDGTFQNFPFASLGDLVINDAGLVAFSGQMRDTSLGEANDNGLFLGDATELRAVIREGDLLSGGVVTDIRFDFDGGPERAGPSRLQRHAGRRDLPAGPLHPRTELPRRGGRRPGGRGRLQLRPRPAGRAGRGRGVRPRPRPRRGRDYRRPGRGRGGEEPHAGRGGRRRATEPGRRRAADRRGPRGGGRRDAGGRRGRRRRRAGRPDGRRRVGVRPGTGGRPGRCWTWPATCCWGRTCDCWSPRTSARWGRRRSTCWRRSAGSAPGSSPTPPGTCCWKAPASGRSAARTTS